ncbi:MAG: hypothetical protein NXI04_17505 [Planctomycetaceae bacterium]|nr:hypothetical protein [Planctomycetaceae bacterium]
MVDGFFISPRDEPVYREVIQERRSLRQADFEDEPQINGIRGAMIVDPPLGWQKGKCAVLREDAEFSFSYEVSINGYPGFGKLDVLRGRIVKAGQERNPDFSGEFTFRRDADNSAIIQALPKYWRTRVQVTGGKMRVDGKRVANPDFNDPETDPEFIFEDTMVNTGRWFIAFNEAPEEFVFAKTEGLTQDEIISLLGFNDDGSIPDHPVDENGFPYNLDERLTVRVRQVPFVVSSLTTEFGTLVDTSQPSPIAVGALAYISQVPGIGNQLLSVEPRVYQDLGGIFTPAVFAAATDIVASLEEESG